MTSINIIIDDLAVNGKVVKHVQFQGQLDESNIDEKSKIIYELIEKTAETTNYLFDFGELAYMNSKSIGYLTDWFSKISEKNGQLIITQARPNILDILNVVGVTKIITFVDTLEEAKLKIGA